MSSLQRLDRVPRGFIGEKIKLMLEAEGFPTINGDMSRAKLLYELLPGLNALFGHHYKKDSGGK